jgi:hypothetical protein
MNTLVSRWSGRAVLVAALCLGGGCSRTTERAGASGPGSDFREIFPHVRLDKENKVVEFDGEVPIDCHNPKTPRIYLEVTVCTRNSKEHETLVVTDAKPSHVHAALLLAGLKPGKPGSWRPEGNDIVRIPPEGDAVEVTIVYRGTDGREVEIPADEWAINAATGKKLGEGAAGAWVFAGSRMVPYQGHEFYDADGTGTLIGLTTFGSETVAYTRIFSPESSVDEPEWIADAAGVPGYGTRVVVRVRAVSKK